MPLPKTDDVRLAALRDDIYAAALDPDGWRIALEKAADWVGADAACAYLPSLQPGRGFSVDHVIHNMPDAKFALDIAEQTGRFDVWTEVGIEKKLLKPGFIGKCQTIVNDYQFDENPWSHTYYRDADLRRYMGFFGRTPIPEAKAIGISFFRRSGASDFCDEALQRLQCVRDDLERAGRMQFRLRAERSTKQMIASALDAHTDAIFALDAQGRVQIANAAADALLSQGYWLRVIEGRLAVGTGVRPAQIGLERLVATLADRRSGEVALEALDGRRLFLLATPSATASGAPFGVVMAFVGGQTPSIDPDRLVRLFGLTDAETEVACALIAGQSTAAIARERGVATDTVRKQLQAIFDKTGQRRQSQVVSMAQALARLSSAGAERSSSAE